MGRRAILLAFLAALVAVIPASGSGAQTEAGSGAVSADQVGWWNSLQGIESGTPLAPIGGVSPGFPQEATGAPAGTFTSALRLGEIDKVGAVGITIDALPGATVEEFTMTLTESADPAANNGSAPVAAVQACPILAFWVGVENGRFNGRPEADCTLSAAPGTRDENGRWTFDLKDYGQKVLSVSSTLGEHGVLLVPVGAPPETFQVTWAGLGSETPPEFTFKATGGQEPDDGFSDGGFDSTGGDFSSDGGADFGASTFDDDRGAGFETAQPETPVGGDTESEPTPAGGQPAPPVDRALGGQVGNIAGNLPPFVLLGFLGLLAVLAMAGLALSRPAVPAEAVVRRGGVSRALAARRTARSRPMETTT